MRNDYNTLLRIILPIIAGMVVNRKTIASDSLLITLLTLCFILAFLIPAISKRIRYQNEPYSAIITMINLTLLGSCLQIHNNRKFKYYDDLTLIGGASEIQLKAISHTEKREKNYRVLCKIVNSVYQQPDVYVYCNLKSSYVPQFGDIFKVKKELQKIQPPKQGDTFDYQQYCFDNNIGYSVYLNSKDLKMIDTVHKISFQKTIYTIRDKLLTTIEKHAPDKESYDIAAALLLGHDEISDEMRQRFSSAGTIHVLCVSGLHVATIYMLISTIAKAIFRKKAGSLIAIVILWIYACITGLSPSVVRASLMLSMSAIGDIFKIKTQITNNICGSALILMLLNPNIIFSIGAQMSYAAVSGIIIFSNHFSVLTNQLFSSGKNNILSILGKKIFELMGISIAVQLIIGPVILFYFNNFSTYFLFANIVSVPLATIALYIGVTLLIAETMLGFMPVIGMIIAKFFYFSIRILIAIATFIDGLPYSNLKLIEAGFLIIFVAAIIAAFIKMTFVRGLDAKLIKIFLLSVIIFSGFLTLRNLAT